MAEPEQQQQQQQQPLVASSDQPSPVDGCYHLYCDHPVFEMLHTSWSHRSFVTTSKQLRIELSFAEPQADGFRPAFYALKEYQYKFFTALLAACNGQEFVYGMQYFFCPSARSVHIEQMIRNTGRVDDEGFLAVYEDNPVFYILDAPYVNDPTKRYADTLEDVHMDWTFLDQQGGTSRYFLLTPDLFRSLAAASMEEDYISAMSGASDIDDDSSGISDDDDLSDENSETHESESGSRHRRQCGAPAA